ncbi:MAG: phosphatase PAP2 family protein, partial [Mucinivorans sp.]
VGGYLGGLYGTVSSHAANSLAFMLLSSSVVRNRYYTVLMLLWVVALCYSRLYLGVHFPMDIIFGLLDGALWGSFWWVVYKNMAKKHYICRLKS